MKKLLFVAFLAVIGFAFTAPAFAIDHQFGGYWRTRMYTQKNFSGTDNGVQDISRADTRTRLYYTAVINDNLKLVNKFEMNAVWGGGSYGNIGADGLSVVVKNTYAEFTNDMGLFRVGTQAAVISRAFIFDDDFTGVVAVVGPATMLYAKVAENGINVGSDIAVYHVNAAFDLGAVKLTPGFTYVDDADSEELWMLALDVDSDMFWGTFIYEGGEAGGLDVSAWLAAAGASVSVSDMLSVHGQVFYATGDDNAADTDQDAFTYAGGQAYYWAEIMGAGTFDNQTSNGSPGTTISNVMALNMGVTAMPMDKLTVSADLWYAQLAEDVAGEDKLGVELDLKATYQLVDGLNLDVIGAYLFADDATTGGGTNDENPWEVGTRLSLSF